MRRPTRALRLLERYRLKELATWAQLRLSGDHEPGIPGPDHSVAGGSLAAVPDAIAGAAVEALGSIGAALGMGGPDVLEVQRAGHLHLIADNGPWAPWSEWLADAYSGRRWAWYPYSASTRLLVWVLRASVEEIPGEITPLVRACLRDHVTRVGARLETHLGGNHLLRQLCAVVLGSRALGSRDVPAETLLLKEIEVQFGEYGAHFENAPMYHAHALFDALLTVHALDDQSRRRAVRALGPAVAWLDCVTKPDGTFARFGDSTDAVVPSSERVLEVAREVLPGGTAAAKLDTPGCGLWSRRWGSGNWLAFRASAEAPRTCPGHWHDDLLAVELTLGGVDLLENAGIFSYGPGAERNYSRSARAHSTIDPGVAQAEKWGVFRVGRTPKSTARVEGPDGCRGTYTPVSRPQAEVSRRVVIDPATDVVTISDQLLGLPSARVRFLFGPGLSIEQVGPTLRVLGPAGFSAALTGEGVECVEVSETPHFPVFGRRQTVAVAVFHMTSRARWTISRLT